MYYIFVYFTLSKNKKYLICIIILIIFIKNTYILDTNYYTYFLDVGQGDISLIKNKDDTTIIDTGGILNSTYKLSDNIIMFLNSIGINKINTLILTHGDYDHMGEAINLVNNFKVEKVIFNCGEFNDLEQDLINVLDKKQIQYY